MDKQESIDPTLEAHFAELRRATAGLNSPRGVEKELMQAFARQFAPKRRWYHKLGAAQWSAAGAVCSAGALALLLVLSPGAFEAANGGAAPVSAEDGAVFIALESLERIELEPEPRVVEAEMPRTMLASLGVPVTPDNAGDTVHAEMLVAADGQPLAVRLSTLN